MSRPLRIGLIMQGTSGWTGGSEYIRNLVTAFSLLPREETEGCELCLISSQPAPDSFRSLLAAEIPLPQRKDPSSLAGRLIDRAAERLGRTNKPFTDLVARERLDFIYPLTADSRHTANVTLPLGDALGACRWAGWIPDFQHRYLPQLFLQRELDARDQGIALLAGDAKTIVFSSHDAAADFARFYPAAKARADVLRFATCPQASWFEGDPIAVARQFYLPERFLLVSNQFWQHKNHRLLFEALSILRRSGVQPSVVLTGHPYDYRNRDYFNTLLRTLHEAGLAGQIHLLGLIERQEQIQLMRRCIAVVQPSLFEGWSTVVEDARSLGRPILMSDLGVHREQAPPHGSYFERASAESLAGEITRLWDTLPAGPDLASEAKARAEAVIAAQSYARNFLRIARAAA